MDDRRLLAVTDTELESVGIKQIRYLVVQPKRWILGGYRNTIRVVANAISIPPGEYGR